jgi:hypothetical protein
VLDGLRDKTVRIPLRVVEGEFRPCYGSTMPKLVDGAIVDLVIPEYALSAYDFARFRAECTIRLLPRDSVLMIGLRPPGRIPRSLCAQADPSKSKVLSDHRTYASVRLLEDLMLCLRRGKRVFLRQSACEVPALGPGAKAKSLNDAYTLLSQKYETDRMSHTGHVFREVFYWDESQELWRRLDDLRIQKEEEFEQALAREDREADNDSTSDKADDASSLERSSP